MTPSQRNAGVHPTIIVRRMRVDDIGDVMTIHCQQFPNSRSTLLGHRFLRKMYRWFLICQPDLSIVVDLDGKVVAFAVGAIGGYGRRIFRYALAEVIYGLLSQPYLLARGKTFNAGMSLMKGLKPRFNSTSPIVGSDHQETTKASLASIAVSKEVLGKGIGKTALGAFEEAAKQKGVNKLGLSVECDNIAARRLYESCGWKLQRDPAESAYYGKCLTPNSPWSGHSTEPGAVATALN